MDKSICTVALNIFPGSELTSFKKHLDIFEQANLKVIHHSIHDYRPTLEAWFNRLVANQTAAIELVGVQNYNKYQCYLADWTLDKISDRPSASTHHQSQEYHQGKRFQTEQ